MYVQTPTLGLALILQQLHSPQDVGMHSMMSLQTMNFIILGNNSKFHEMKV